MGIGESIVRIDGREKVRGETRFVADLAVPGLLHGALVRSPVPCGRLRRLRLDPDFDWSSVTVVTPADIPGTNVVRVIRDDMPCLVDREIAYAGEPVALVAAPDRESARRAAAAVRVDAEPRPALFGIDRLVEIHERAPGDLVEFHRSEIRRGDVARGLAEADLVVEGEYRTGPQEHVYLEPQGVLALPEGGGRMRIVGSLQCPFYVRPAVAHVLGVPDESVIVEQAATGGAFGGKEDFPSFLGSYAALLARKAGRPVRIVFDRTEDIAFTPKRHAAWIRHRSGVTRDGSLVALDIEILLDAGAYVTLSPVVLSRAVLHASGVYRCPNVRVLGRAVRSNVPPAGAFRGFGAPQVLFALESHVDEIAARLAVSPLEIRRRNVLRLGDAMPTGQILEESVGGTLCLDTVAEESRFETRRRQIEGANRVPGIRRRRGLGLATVLHGASFTGTGEKTLHSRAALRLHADGSVEILASSTEMGQGSATALSQIVAESLALPIGRIRFPLPDTSRVPNSGPTVASRTTMIVGRILETCGRGLVAGIERALGGGTARDGEGFRAPDGRRWSWVEAAGIAAGETPLTVEREYDFPPGQVFDEATNTGSAYPVYSWGAIAAEVSVDTRTFEVRPERLWLAYEIGRAIHPVAARGQLEGGSIQALGWALFEKMDLDDGGRCVQDRLQTYIVPTSADVPETRLRVLEIPYSRGPGGAKGIGEMPMNGVAPAVRNAVRHAVGVGIDSLPVTPEKIFAALEGARSEER
jgi:CO/xanthine dehydrogenase Mo-binding subunit